MEEIVYVRDVAVVKTVGAERKLLSCKDCRIVKDRGMKVFGAGSGIVRDRVLYVLDDRIVEVPLVGLSFSSENNKLVSGSTTQLEPIATPENATLALTYTSSDTAKATVDVATGVVTPVASAGNVTINAVNKNGVRASIDMKIVPFAVSVVCQGIDKTDNSVNNIFSKWQLTKKGNATHYKYSETIKENGVESTLQTVDWTEFPTDGIVNFELYAEFGYKYINWSFKNADYEETVVVPVLYKEPELVHYEFTVDVQCSQQEATVITAEIPFFKYGKLFCQNLRNDDHRPSMWRGCFRWCNRDLDKRNIPYSHNTDDDIATSDAGTLLRAPRRLCYTDGCGIKKVFTFDTAGTVTWEDGTISWEKNTFRDEVYTEDIWRMKDYGGHFILHNIFPLASDPVPPKFDMDISYALQRDRKIIYDKFGYTSIHVANPDGTWYHTRPCIKDPRTILFSGGGNAYGIDPNGIYGKPEHRVVFGHELSAIPLSEIRNTLLISYDFFENWFDRNSWIEQHTQALVHGKKTFMNYITHLCGFSADNAGTGVQWTDTKNYFAEIHDVAGSNGDDTVWICSGDEMVEYMYYQRCANIHKEMTATGCRFIVAFDIPDYLSYKTYSLILKNLPEDAMISRSSNVPLTCFSKNMETGLINWGISTDITERANRYYQKYIANPTTENLDKAWYFIRQCGELGTSLSAQLPVFNENPVLESVIYNANQTKPDNIALKIKNSNKEFGEAEWLDVSENESFNQSTGYAVPFAGHKYYDPLDETCKDHDFTISVPLVFGEPRNYYVRLRNIYGYSNPKMLTITINRVEGVNDPGIELIPDLQFKYDDHIECTINYENISAFRYKLDDGIFTEWANPVETFNITMPVGNHVVVIQGKNNLDEIVEDTTNVNFTGKQKVILFGNITNPGNVDGVGYINRIDNGNSKTRDIYDIYGNIIGKDVGKYYPYFKEKIDLFRSKYNITSEIDISSNYWNVPTFINDNGKYPNEMITNGGNKFIQLYGGIQSDSTCQAVKYLTGIPTGTYNVKMLLSAKADANYKYPNIIRVQNQTIRILSAEAANVIDNNQYWYQFDNVVVDADEMLLISQYTDIVFTGSIHRLSPIVLLEITKT